MSNKIFLSENSNKDFSNLQKIIIASLSKDDIRYTNKNSPRILIFIKNTIPALFLNIRATLWYYNGFSYPHLSSEDSFADEAFIVLTTSKDYVLENSKKFKKLISVYNELDIKDITKLSRNNEILLVEESIKYIESELIKSKIHFSYYKVDNNQKEISYDPSDISDENNNSEFNKKTDKILDDFIENKETDNISDNYDESYEDFSKDKKIENNQSNYSNGMCNNIFKGMNFNNSGNSEITNDRALIIIKPRVIKIRMEFVLLNKINESGFLVLRYVKKKLPKEFWEQFYPNISHKDFFEDYCNYLASDFVGIAVIYSKNDVFTKIRNLIGPTNPKECKQFHLRYQFGLDTNDNGIHASDSQESFKHELEILKNFKVSV